MGAGAALTAAIVLVATLRHAEVVRWSDAHGPLANLAIVPPAFVVIACASRHTPLAVAGLLALAVGLVLALLWLLVGPDHVARTPVAVPRPDAVIDRAVPAAPPARLWASAARDEPGPLR